MKTATTGYTNRNTSTRDGERGQVLVIAALLLTALLGLLALIVDAGLAYSHRSGAQGASDNAALAAAEVLAKTGNRSQAIAAAQEYAQRNGFTDGVDGRSVTVLNPPTSGPHAGDDRFFEVIVNQPAANFFLRAVSHGSNTVGARAVAGINPGNVLPYNLVSLRDDCQKHTLKVDLGGTLTVDGGLYINSGSSDPFDVLGNPLPCGDGNWGPPGYGDGFDIFGVGGSILARDIKVHGGWETHDGDLVYVDGVLQTALTPPITGKPVLPDPLASVLAPNLADHPVRNGSVAGPSPLVISSGAQTLQPGIYYGGIQISGTANVTFAPGIYIMGGGGMAVTGSAALNADGVMIYNTRSGSGATGAGAFAAVNIDTTGAITLKSPHTGPYAGMVVFQDRAATTNIILGPGNGMSGLAGTVYAPGWNAGSKSDLKCAGDSGGDGDEKKDKKDRKSATTDSGASTVVVKASGVANLQVISAQILVCGADATFQFDASGLANAGLSLVE